MFAELRRRHVTKKLQFGNLADPLYLLGRHLCDIGLQVICNVVEDFLVWIQATVAPLRIRRNARLRAVFLGVPVPAGGVADGYLQLHVLAVRFLDATTYDDVRECFTRRDHPHRAPVTCSLQRRLQVIRQVARLGTAYFLVNAGIRRIVVLGYAVVEFDDAYIEQQRLFDRSACDNEFGFFGCNDFIDSAALDQKQGSGNKRRYSPHIAQTVSLNPVVLPILFPQALAELRVFFREGGFAKLPCNDVIVDHNGNVVRCPLANLLLTESGNR